MRVCDNASPFDLYLAALSHSCLFIN